jgi:AraC-like DNA-binding protein
MRGSPHDVLDRPEIVMDPLSDVLSLLNVSTASPSRLEAGGRWALAFKGYQHVKVGAVVAGTCWIIAGDTPPVRVEAGDCYLLASGRPYKIAGDLSTAPGDGYAMFAAADSSTLHYGTDPHAPDRTIMIGGNVTFDETTAALLLDNLPPVARIAAGTHSAQGLHPTLRLLADEIAAELPGAEVMTGHLTQILFIHALRTMLSTEAHGDKAIPGWLGALADPRIGAALTLMHRRAAHRWTVAELARAVGMSRSTFALRFKTLVGLPPLDYLLRWRIRAAEGALRDGSRTVASVAAECGYASESAFSNAFKRVTGHPPARSRVMEGPVLQP